MNQTYSTSQIAKIVGVHPNTVRMYEEWGLIQKPMRKENGYRIFTDIHIDQFRLVKTAFQIEVLQAGLRKKIIAAVKLSAKWQFDEAIAYAKEYRMIASEQIENAKEAAELAQQLLSGNKKNDSSVSLKRMDVAKILGLTIDTIRNWEMNGLIKVKRKENGYRVYDEEDIKRLKIIRSLRCANYSLSAILRMINALEENKNIEPLSILNTPEDDEDIIYVCDKLIDSLEEAKKNAAVVLEMLQEMKAKYRH